MWISIGLEKILERTYKLQPKRVYLGHYKLQQQTPWFDEECSERLHKKKLQRLQNPSEMKR
jgi:hypothetical protein